MQYEEYLSIPDADALPLFGWRSDDDTTKRDVVLCLHGIESHAGWFQDVAALLVQDGIDCLSYDRPGHGSTQSSAPIRISLGQMASHVAFVVLWAKQRYRRVHVLGHSWGGLLAAYSYERLEPLIGQMILVAPGIYTHKRLPLGDAIKVAFGTLRKSETEIAIPLLPSDFSDDPLIIRRIEDDKKRRTSCDASEFFATFQMQQIVRMRTNKTPHLNVWLAGHDAIVDNDLMTSFCHSRAIPLKVFENNNHCLLFECPELLAKAMRNLIGGAHE